MMIHQVQALAVAGILDDPGKVGSPHESAGSEAGEQSANDRSDIRIRLSKVGEPVGSAENHENVLEGAEGENGRFCRLGDRSLQPGSSLVIQTDAYLGETAVVQHDAKAVELSGDSRDVREVLGSRI